MNTSRRRFSIPGLVWCLGLLAAVLGGCSKSQEAQNALRQTSPRIHLLHYFTGSLSAGMDHLGAYFAAQATGPILESVPFEHEAFKSAISLQLEGPNPPELFSYWAGSRARNLVEKGLVVPLDELYSQNLPQGAFDPVTRMAVGVDKRDYMVPLTRHLVGFYYDKKFFADNGLSIPLTWTDFHELVKACRKAGRIPLALGNKDQWPAQFYFDYLCLRRFGPAFHDSLANLDIRFDDPRVEMIFADWMSLDPLANFSPDQDQQGWDEAGLDLVNGQAAMTLMGTWLTPVLEAAGWHYGEDFGFFIFPAITPLWAKVGLGPIDGIMASPRALADPVRKDAVFAVLERFGGSEVQLQFNLAAGSVAPSTLVDTSQYTPIMKDIKRLVSESSAWAFAWDLSCPPGAAEIILGAFDSFLASPGDYRSIITGTAASLQVWQRGD